MEKLPADILTLEPVAVQTGAGVVVEAGVVRRAAGPSLVHAATFRRAIALPPAIPETGLPGEGGVSSRRKLE